MSTITGSRAAPQPPLEDIYRYGWRDIVTTKPDGSVEVKQLPLTLEDVLHPQQGDHVVESTLHDNVQDYLADVARARTCHDPMALVTRDVGVYWDDDPSLDHHCPDVGVIFGVRDRDRNRPSFFVAQEGTRPRLIIEVVSPHTRKNDVETKFVEYHQARVQHYVILDRLTETSPWEIRGYRHAPDHYEELMKDERGRLWLEDIRVWLAVDGQRVICYDPATNEAIPDYLELTRVAKAAEERLRQVEAELARLRGKETT